MPIRIRPAEPKDVDTLLALYASADETAHNFLPDFFRSTSEYQRSKADIDAQLADGDSALLVAEDERGAVGLVSVAMQSSPTFGGFVPRRYAHVADLAVDARARREGVGTQLMAAAEAWARDHDADSVELLVVEGNDGAEALYRASGFEPRSRRMWKRFS